jgi:hypothetical protein
MSERQKQIEFLKSLLRWGNSEMCRDFEERLHLAQHNEDSIRRKIGSLLLLLGLSLAGFGYTAVFLPEAFDYPIPLLVRVFCVMGLGAIISLAVFSCWWIWYRAVVNTLQEEGRSIVHLIFNSRLPLPTMVDSVTTECQPTRYLETEPEANSIISLAVHTSSEQPGTETLQKAA